MKYLTTFFLSLSLLSHGQKTKMTYFNWGNEAYENTNYSTIGLYPKTRFDVAIKYLTNAIELDSNFSDAYRVRGAARTYTKDYKGALDDLNKALKDTTQSFNFYIDAYKSRGIVKNDLNDFNGAIDDYDKIIKLTNEFNLEYKINNKVDFEIYYLRGWAKSGLKKYNDAIADFTKAINIKGDNIGLYNSRGNAKDHLGDHKGAIEDFKKAEYVEKHGSLYEKEGYYKQGPVIFYKKGLMPNESTRREENNKIKQTGTEKIMGEETFKRNEFKGSELYFHLIENFRKKDKRIFDFKKEILNNSGLNENEYKDNLIKFDFSSLWNLTNNDLVFGFIGENNERIRIKFISIAKNPNSPYIYNVTGKSKVKNNICEFQGQIKISNIRCFRNMHLGIDNENNGAIKQGLLIAEYHFFENTKQEYSGIFDGILYSFWYIDSNNEVKYDDIQKYSDSYLNNQFIGTWKSYTNNLIKTCNWGDYRIPFADDLDTGSGEFSPSKKFIHYGWENFNSNNYPGLVWWK